MAQKSDSRELDKVIVRLPDGMRDRIKAAAEANNRSMNAEIVATLEETYPDRTVLQVSAWNEELYQAIADIFEQSLGPTEARHRLEQLQKEHDRAGGEKAVKDVRVIIVRDANSDSGFSLTVSRPVKRR
ncbi:Arc family DNA-binding protein [Cereibacter sphaeroides]|uniref:Arc family DNA-binding protein n=1 Tax=Cereibacter sphaeroides TaxID=1063 RepID=A0AAX1UST2_CERSP|nr:Arc family DNA-binding protein [Cereibacter sphaeroides]RHZ98836.1 Arc family DNA-binding protein [Cereibacter sphaeroides]